MVNPDGGQYDISGGAYRHWRKNRQPTPDTQRRSAPTSTATTTTAGAAAAARASVRGQHATAVRRPFSTPETRAMRDFVLSRVVDGVQQHPDAHHASTPSGGWCCGRTATRATDVPPDMTATDHQAFVAMGKAMAASNGYTARAGERPVHQLRRRGSAGSTARQRIFSYAFEMTPATPAAGTTRPTSSSPGRPAATARRCCTCWSTPTVPMRATRQGAAYCGPLLRRPGDRPRLDEPTPMAPTPRPTVPGARGIRGRLALRQLGGATSGPGVLVTGAGRCRRGRRHDDASARRGPRCPRTAPPRSGCATGWASTPAARTPRPASGPRVVRPVTAATSWRTALPSAPPRTADAAWRSPPVAIGACAGPDRPRSRFEAADAGGDATVEAAVDDVRVTAANP